MLTTREGAEERRSSRLFKEDPCVVAAAMRVIEMDDVFVARMAWDGQISARREKMDDLRSGISYEVVIP